MPLALGLAAGEAVLTPARPLASHPVLTAAPELDGVPMAIAVACAALPESEARLLRLAALIPAPDLDHLTVAAATATPATHTRQLLEELAARHLLEHAGRQPVRGDVYRIRPGVPELFRSSDDTRLLIVQRCLDYLIATAQETVQRLTPHHLVLPRQHRHHPAEPVHIADDRAGLDWLEAIAPAIPSALAAARELGEHQALVVLTHDLWPLFHRLRRTDLSIAFHELGLASARIWGHHMAIREMTTTLAISHKRAGDHEEARRFYREALALATDDHDPHGIAQCTAGIGATLYDAERYAAAEPELTRAIELYADLDDRRGADLAKILLGSAAARQGNTDFGVPLLWQAIVDLGSLAPPDPLNMARAKVFLGEAQSLAGEHGLAVATISEARREFTDLGHDHWTAYATEFLGQARRTLRPPGHRPRLVHREPPAVRKPRKHPRHRAPPEPGHRPGGDVNARLPPSTARLSVPRGTLPCSTRNRRTSMTSWGRSPDRVASATTRRRGPAGPPTVGHLPTHSRTTNDHQIDRSFAMP
ncbi:tetratricopeptide repeat protein [Streptomyces sp. Y1]|uniref:Tetratricopeptide repeat protein n=1 Tax=Streptomyces sp. Y1 TaxID=3238634 RepID=A0AB39TS25_9ACTN